MKKIGNNKEKIITELLKNINLELIKRKDEEELMKFQKNIAKYAKSLLTAPTDKKKKIIEVFKEVSFEIIRQVPVVTPVITALLQTISSEDLGSKIDTLGLKIDTLGETLGLKIDTLGETLGLKIDTLGQTLDTKMDTMINLQRETLKILDERLPRPKKNNNKIE